MTTEDLPTPLRPAPAGHGLRRARTVDDSSPLRRRSYIASDSDTAPRPPRRSSNFSDYSLSEARELLNPMPDGGDPMAGSETSSLASLSLAFALLPALVGVVHKNGSAMVTDVMLLGLAGVFLHWSVTQPWTWYHSAQEVRILNEASVEQVIDDDSDIDLASPVSTPLDQVPEDQETTEALDVKPTRKRVASQQQSALTELHVYEMLALISCAILPLMGAYILHAIRSQLSRPSEGLVSNFNLTIFMGFAELRVFAHFWKLVQSRTLHLQRIVQGGLLDSQLSSKSQDTIRQLLSRMEQLESRAVVTSEAGAHEASKSKQETAILTREVRNAIQPELDALNRAVRRYEKKATVLQAQTEGRFVQMDQKLDNAIALAATTAKINASHKNFFMWAIESLVTMALLPFKAAITLVLLPFNTILALVQKKQKVSPAKSSRSSRTGKPSVQSRYGGDRVPTRVSKR